jgi:hypothetical protein
VLARVCADDIVSAFGLGGMEDGILRRAIRSAALVPARRLARQVAEYDRIVGESGLSEGGLWALGRMARRWEFRGRERVPVEGPVLLVSNHPGLADAVALFAAVPRDDLRVVAAESALLEALPNTSRSLIPIPEESSGRLRAVREVARHLRRRGAVLTFPGGRIEPDPALLPAASTEALERWSASVDLFARLAPNLVVVPAVVSGVVSPAALHLPITRVRRERRDREWLAATLQMLVPALRRGVSVRVEFGHPVSPTEAQGRVSGRVLAEARRLILERDPQVRRDKGPGSGARRARP